MQNIINEDNEKLKGPKGSDHNLDRKEWIQSKWWVCNIRAMELRRREEGLTERGSIIHTEALGKAQTKEELKVSSFTVKTMDMIRM